MANHESRMKPEQKSPLRKEVGTGKSGKSEQNGPNLKSVQEGVMIASEVAGVAGHPVFMPYLFALLVIHLMKVYCQDQPSASEPSESHVWRDGLPRSSSGGTNRRGNQSRRGSHRSETTGGRRGHSRSDRVGFRPWPPDDPNGIRTRFYDTQVTQRFHKIALSELRAGRKESHWSWYIFPTPPFMRHGIEAGSYQNQLYALRGNDTEEFLRFTDPNDGERRILLHNYHKIMATVLSKLSEKDPSGWPLLTVNDLVSHVDAPKLVSSVNHFLEVSRNLEIRSPAGSKFREELESLIITLSKLAKVLARGPGDQSSLHAIRRPYYDDVDSRSALDARPEHRAASDYPPHAGVPAFEGNGELLDAPTAQGKRQMQDDGHRHGHHLVAEFSDQAGAAFQADGGLTSDGYRGPRHASRSLPESRSRLGSDGPPSSRSTSFSTRAREQGRNPLSHPVPGGAAGDDIVRNRSAGPSRFHGSGSALSLQDPYYPLRQ